MDSTFLQEFIFFGKNIDELVQVVNFGSHYYNDRDVDVKLLSGR